MQTAFLLSRLSDEGRELQPDQPRKDILRRKEPLFRKDVGNLLHRSSKLMSIAIFGNPVPMRN